MTGNRLPGNRGDPDRGEPCLGGWPLAVRPFLVTAVAVPVKSPCAGPGGAFDRRPAGPPSLWPGISGAGTRIGQPPAPARLDDERTTR
jgi:hypothetical protein